MQASSASKGLVLTMVSKHVKAASGHAVPTAVAHRILRPSAALALLVLPWDIGAQVGPDLMDVWAPQEPMPLSAAIAEIRTGPAHAATGTAKVLGGAIDRIDFLSASVPDSGPLRHQEAPRDTLASSGRIFATATGVGLLAYVLGGGVYYYSCGSAPPGSSCLGQAALGMSIPVAALGVTAYGMGADTRRAVFGSILGGAVGLVVFSADLDHPLVSLGLATVAHAAVTTLASKIHFRRRPRP